jgi:hypothetical protein
MVRVLGNRILSWLLRAASVYQGASLTDREKPGVAFWATVVMVAALVGYPLSIGPAQWLIWNANFPGLGEAAHVAYRPIAFAWGSSATAARVIDWYLRLWVDFSRAPGVNLPPGVELEPTSI